ncbi:MAG: DNA repair protein RadC [Prevotellaceae bacterium]|nr:DNA repair protein RadC [Prevotellaceae bacterium]
MEKLTINRWAEEDRPREKMMQKGVQALSDAELLAILIGSGNRDESAVALMQRVLERCGNDLHQLGKWEVRDFARFKGLGPAKSIAIMAALELGKRRSLQEHAERTVIRSSITVYELFHPLLCDLPTEEFWLLLMNQASKVIDKVCLSRGGIDLTIVDTRTVLREALLRRATQMVLVHNHPSGNSHPSEEDKRLTAAVKTAAEIMNIRLVDHLILVDGSYYSFADEGTLRMCR